MAFNHNEIEKKQQLRWQKESCFKAESHFKKKKFYVLGMFPYPSGAGLHVGHLASYLPVDITARYKRARGFNVLNPIGYDAFGLPAEQYAIETGVHPEETTKKAIDNFRRQLQSFGFSFDWDREVSTCGPSYYKWTQKLFLYFFKKKLAYKKKESVNWCPKLRTILANEEVIDGKSERGRHPVIQKKIDQWMLRITAYAEPLLQGLLKLDWPERTIEGQKNWIGKSPGLVVNFSIQGSQNAFPIFTTRPDTLFGSSFVVFSPEHPLIEKEFSKNKEYKNVLEYQEKSRTLKNLDKKKEGASTGVFSGSYAIHPLTKKPLPIWVADYVLMDYGTGAIMAVPAHDERDFLFAKKFNLPIVPVIKGEPLPFIGDGPHFNSEFLDGLNNKEAVKKMSRYIEKQKWGFPQIQYKLRDWIFSRQRYWGEPFPLVNLDGKIEAVGEEELPVKLPETADFAPSEEGEPPLARVLEFLNYEKNGRKGKRETDTMPGYAASSWYFLRYTDPHNDQEPFSFENQKYWMPVDLYIGGPEHTVGHLLYARFWQKFFYDLGLVSHDEPFKKLIHQGMILGSDGQKMSKSRGNTIAPDDIREKYGADAVRLYISFLGPLEKDKPWGEGGIEGCRRFLDRLWRLIFDEKGLILVDEKPAPEKLGQLCHQTVKKVTQDIENFHFNTAVSSMMILVNELYDQKSRNKEIIQKLCRLLEPFAPHIAEEIWEKLGSKTLLCLEPWPEADPRFLKSDEAPVAIQVNGKTKAVITLSLTASEEDALKQAQALPKISKILDQASIQKVIYKKGRILNIVCKAL